MRKVRISEKKLINIIKRVLKESDEDYEYCLIDHEGYYFIPDVDAYIKHIIDAEVLIPSYRLHLVNLEATKAKREMQDMDLDKYDYPEGIDHVIECGERLLNVFETVIEQEHGEAGLNLVKRDALTKGETL